VQRSGGSGRSFSDRAVGTGALPAATWQIQAAVHPVDRIMTEPEGAFLAADTRPE